MKSFGVVLVQRGIDHARRDRVEADVALRIFACEAESDRGLSPPLVIIGTDAGAAGDGVIGQRCGNGGDAAPGTLRQHLLHRQLGDEDEAVKVGGDEIAKLVGSVVRERFGAKMPALLTT